MPPVFPLRRRTDRFAELVDQPVPLRRRTVTDLTDLADLADRLRQTDVTPKPDPVFRADLRAMLVATAKSEGIGATAKPVPAPPPPPPPAPVVTAPRVPHRARLAVAVGLAVGVVGVSTLSAASSGAVPGDSLYSLKRSAEQAQLAITASDINKGNLYLSFARKRMQEADAIWGDPAEIQVILGDMDTDTRKGVKLLTAAAVTGHDPAPLDMIAAFATAQAADMPEMMSDIDGAAHGRAVDSARLLDDVRIRIGWLRTDLSCTSIQSARIDDLGPNPQSCSPRGNQSPLPESPVPAATARPTPAAPPATGRPTPTQAARPAPNTSGAVPVPPPAPTVPASPAPSLVPASPDFALPVTDVPADTVAVDPAPPTVPAPADVPALPLPDGGA